MSADDRSDRKPLSVRPADPRGQTSFLPLARNTRARLIGKPLKRIVALLLSGGLGLFNGCDAIESLDKPPDGNVTEQQQVVQQLGQVTPVDQALPTDAIQEMLIGPPQGEWPAALPVLEWKSSLEAGWQEVRKEGRPLLVLLRCPGTTDENTFDHRFLAPTPMLAELLRQFVTVELTDGQDIDLERMPFARYQDPDQSWWCWVLSPQGQVYSVLGRENPGAPELTEAEVSDWLTRVLNHHWDPRRSNWNADGPIVPEDRPPRSIVQNPGYDRWRKGAESLRTLRSNGECMCCHQVQDTLWVEEDLGQQFRVTEDYWLWVPPANCGLSFASEALPRVTLLASGSFAEKARTEPESTVGIIDEQRCFSTTDVRAAINSIRGAIRLKTYAELNGAVVSFPIAITGGASRDYDLTWRTSIRDSVLAGHPGFIPTPVSAKLRNDLRLQNRLALKPQIGEGTPAWQRGLRPEHVIIKSGEFTNDLTPQQFLFLFTLNNQVGSQAELTVLRGEANWQPARFEIPSLSVLDIPPDQLKPPAE